MLNHRPELGAVLLSRAAQLVPENGAAWTNLGVAYEALGQPGRARAAAEQAIAVAPTRSATPWVNLARLQLGASENAAASHTLDTAAALGMRDPRLTALRARLGGAAHAVPR